MRKILLTESLDRPYVWKWTSMPGALTNLARRAQFRTKFKHHLFTYQVTFVQQTGKSLTSGTRWNMSFRPDDASMTRLEKMVASGEHTVPVLFSAPSSVYGKLNLGQPFRKFATVIDILKDFLKKESPVSIRFTASATDPARIRLYTRLIGMVADHIPGWKGIVNPHEVNPTFYIQPTSARPMKMETLNISRTVPPREDPPTRGTQL